MAMCHHDSAIQNFKARVEELTCYSVANLASDEKRPFMPLKAVEAQLAENQNVRLNNILIALYRPELPPTYAEAILKRYTAVFCILLEIGKGNLIHRFTEHDTLHDFYLPFNPRTAPVQFPETTGDAGFYQRFCQAQWKYSVPVFQRFLSHSFPPEQILPFVSRDLLWKGTDSNLWKVTLHEDYNRLQTQRVESNHVANTNTFVLKSYNSDLQSGADLFDAEVKAFRRLGPDQGVLGFCGNYVQANTSNIILEYADQGTLDQYFKTVSPPSDGEDIIQFWRRLFDIIKALVAIYKVTWDDPLHEPKISQRWNLDVKPSNILVASNSAPTPYGWKFQLADFSLHQLRSTKPSSDIDNYGTRSYGAPEYTGNTGTARLENPKQGNDIWSLGCVFSEAATWIACSYDGLLNYRLRRKTEIDADCSPAPINNFHDGGSLLNIVQEHHRRLFGMLRHQDCITQSVVDLMIEEMLEIPEGRPTADQLWIKSQRILSRAEDRYAALTNNASEPSKSTIERLRSVPRGPPSIYETAANVENVAFSNRISDQQYTFIESRNAHVLKGGYAIEIKDPRYRFEHRHLPSARHTSSYHGPDSKYVNELLLTNDNSKAPTTDLITSSTSASLGASLLADSDAYPEPITTQPMRPLSSSLTPGLMISNSRDVLSSTEQEHNTTFQRRRDIPRKSRLDAHRVPEVSLSISDAQEWKARRKSRRGAIAPLFNKQSLQRLSERDHIFIIDDAASMTSHWQELRKLVEVFSYILKEVDPGGVNLSFANSTQRLMARSTTKLLRFLEQQNPKICSKISQTDINSRLGDILMEHRKAIRDWASSRSSFKLGLPKRPQPITLYVLTDGMWEGNKNIDQCLDILEKDLNCFENDDSSSGVQFITFGDDPIGREHLARMDDELRGNNFDVTPSSGNIWKMLFGVGSDKVGQRRCRSLMRLPTLKNPLRRMSTAFSLKSAGSRHGADRTDTVVVTDRPKPRRQLPSYGLFEWTSSPSSTMDFVFIHGLDGDRENDWIVRGRGSTYSHNWPKDLLSSQFPHARLLTYGYDSTPWRSPNPLKDIIRIQACVLLDNLYQIRVRNPERPVIMIAQGAGVLLVKSALLQSHLTFGPDSTKEEAIKLSTTSLILLEPPDIQHTDESVLAVLESHGHGSVSNNSRKSIFRDVTWLKLQLESFRSISGSFSFFCFHSRKAGAHKQHLPFVPATATSSPNAHTKQMSPRISDHAGQLLEEPKQIDNASYSTYTTQANERFEVDRINEFQGEDDRDYQAIIRAFEALSREAAKKSRRNWAIYEMERAYAETQDAGFNDSELVRIHPPRNEHFTGRHADLDSIRAAIFSDGKGTPPKAFSSTVEIYGVGGIGKTQLALEFIHRYKSKFSMILWIDAQSRASVQKSFSKIDRTLSRNRVTNVMTTQGSRLNISGSADSTSGVDSVRSLTLTRKAEPQGLPSCSTDLVKVWLVRENNDRWLMVFDGADDEKKSWIQDFFPNTKNGHILITSRHRDLLRYSTRVRLGPMTEEDSVKLLLYSCPDSEERPALELVKRLDCIPLAIAQAGSYIASTKMTTGDYLSRLKETRPQDWDEYATRMKMLFSTSVDEVFESSYQEVKAKDPGALDLLILCSFLAAENIPGVVLEAGSNRSGRRVDDMVDTLFNNGFGRREENLQGFRMHSLVQSWIRQHLSPEKQEALVSRALTTLATVVESKRSRDVKVLQGLEKLLLGHIIACLSRAENITHCDVSWCVLGNICKQQKRYIEAVILYQNGLSDPDIAKKRDCTQRQHLGYELGLLYQLQGRHYDAVEKYKEILEECNRDPPGKDSLHLRGQFLLDIYKALSSVHTRIGGLAQSEEILMGGVLRLEKLFGTNSIQALQLLDISAAEFYDQGDYAQAEELFKWIFSAQIQTLGIVHPRTIHAQEKLARVYFQRDKFEDAEMLCQQYLSGLEKFLDAQHSTILQQVLFLGGIHTKLHKFSEAEASFCRAVKGYEVLGLQHPETLNAREELAMCFEAQQKLKEAHAVYTQVMFGREDGKDPRIKETLRRLLPLMERMGMKEEARQLVVQWSNGFRE